MKCIILISKENLPLALAEALALTKKVYAIYDNLFITNYFKGLEKRLGFSHAIYELLFISDTNEYIDKINIYDWNSQYEKNFAVRTHSKDIEETKIAKLIHQRLSSPKVNLKNPKTKFEFFQKNNFIIVGKLLSEVDKSYLKRKAHFRPRLHPTSMHPALARACINLTGLKTGTIMEPFCGSAGSLIEAGFMGFKLIGYDLDKSQIERAKENLTYYKIKCSLSQGDALKINKTADAIVTDVPYGKGSIAKNPAKLCNDFLKHAKKLTSNMVLIYPNFLTPDFTGWKKEYEFKIYVHKSLTRVIVKLSRSRR